MTFTTQPQAASASDRAIANANANANVSANVSAGTGTGRHKLPAPANVPPPEPTQYLTFMLGTEVFAIGILGIKEIIEYPDLTTVPMMPPCVRGVINLRGAVVPVMDLRARFGQPASAVTKASCIVIVEVDNGEERQVVGVVVDAVNEVLDIAPADVEPPPLFGARIRSDFIDGIGKVKGRFVILLDVAQVLTLDAVDGGLLATARAGLAH